MESERKGAKDGMIEFEQTAHTVGHRPRRRRRRRRRTPPTTQVRSPRPAAAAAAAPTVTKGGGCRRRPAASLGRRPSGEARAGRKRYGRKKTESTSDSKERWGRGREKERRTQ